jgi:hypothetical protein
LPNDVPYVFDSNAESYEANMQRLGYSVPEILLGLHRARVVRKTAASMCSIWAAGAAGADRCSGPLRGNW